MGKDWDKFKEGKNTAGGNTGKDTPYARNRVAPAFYQYGPEQMATLQGFSFSWATEALRVAKPGAMMLCFGGTRTSHRVACGIEDAGWILRDTIMWLYGSGFPKSYNISKGIDKHFGAEREVIGKSNINIYKENKNYKFFSEDEGNPEYEKGNITAPATDEAKLWDGWGTALKPAFEPIIVAMKPLDGSNVENALKYGVAGLNIDGGRVGTEETLKGGSREIGDGVKYGTIRNKDDGYIQSSQGRWPANIIHDGSEEVLEGFPQSKSVGVYRKAEDWEVTNPPTVYGDKTGQNITRKQMNRYAGDSGSAARFFYCAKSSKSERNAGLEGMPKVQKYKKDGSGNSHEVFTSESATDEGWAKKNPNLPVANNHPTVKPLSLMEYLAKLTKTPTGGVVLDPFMGSGTTGMACKKTERDFIGIEKDAHFFEIAEKRIASVVVQREMF